MEIPPQRRPLLQGGHKSTTRQHGPHQVQADARRQEGTAHGALAERTQGKHREATGEGVGPENTPGGGGPVLERAGRKAGERRAPGWEGKTHIRDFSVVPAGWRAPVHDWTHLPGARTRTRLTSA